MIDRMYPRRLHPIVVEAVEHARIVFIGGARQVGKTTLVSEITAPGGERPMTPYTLDDRATRLAAIEDPAGFVAGLRGSAFIDEVHRAPDLLLELKKAVDADTTPGRFIITGSANILANRRILDALPGRIDRLDLWPLSRTEIEGGQLNLIDELLAGRAPQVTGAPVGPDAYAPYIAQGGYPEARQRPAGRVRNRWFRDYISGAVERDVRELADLRHVDELGQLLRLVASQSANLLSYRKIADQLQMSDKTVKAYIVLLEQMFLLRRLPGWKPGFGAREVAKPKAYICDPGLLCYLLGADEARVRSDDQVKGKACETFVASELLKHASWAEQDVRLFHYQRQTEDVDFIVENRAGDIAAVEVKAAATLRHSDWRWLEQLRDARGESFKAGVVVYSGAQTIPLGDRLWAVPYAAMWA